MSTSTNTGPRTQCAPIAASIGRSPTVALLDEVQRQKALGVNVLNLSGGEPDFTTPEHIIARATEALAAGDTHYTPSRGLPELREAIAAKLLADNDIAADPGTDIIVTPSAKHAMFIALAGVIGPGDEVLLPSPTWVSYAPMIDPARRTRHRDPARSARRLRAERRTT